MDDYSYMRELLPTWNVTTLQCKINRVFFPQGKLTTCADHTKLQHNINTLVVSSSPSHHSNPIQQSGRFLAKLGFQPIKYPLAHTYPANYVRVHLKIIHFRTLILSVSNIELGKRLSVLFLSFYGEIG